MDCYERVRQAEINRDAAQRAFVQARAEVDRIEIRFREALPVSETVPCSVAVLPNGRVVVHVWVEKSSEPNQLHVVSPGYYTQDAKPRKQFPGERLGEANLTLRR